MGDSNLSKSKVHGTGKLFRLKKSTYFFDFVELKDERLPYLDLKEWTLIQNTNLHVITHNKYGFSVIVMYMKEWRLGFVLKLGERRLNLMLWKGLVDVNGIPLCFIASREEIRGQWEDHYEFLEFVHHPEEIYFVNSFFPLSTIPSDDCLLHMKWAMPHMDGCIGQSNKGPDVFCVT